MHTSRPVKTTSVLTIAAIAGALVMLIGTLTQAGDGITDLSFNGRCLAHLVMVALIAAVGLAIRPSSKASMRR